MMNLKYIMLSLKLYNILKSKNHNCKVPRAKDLIWEFEDLICDIWEAHIYNSRVWQRLHIQDSKYKM